MTEWFADESFWESFYPAMFPDERFDATPAQVDQMLALTQFDGKDVLDLCCGPDATRQSLRPEASTSRASTSRRFYSAKRKREAMPSSGSTRTCATLSGPDSFDLVINMFTSFGYFEDKDVDVRVLRNIHDSLRDGGVFLIDLIGKEYLAKVFQPTVLHTAADGSTLVQRHEVFDDWSRVRNEWILVQGD